MGRVGLGRRLSWVFPDCSFSVFPSLPFDLLSFFFSSLFDSVWGSAFFYRFSLLFSLSTASLCLLLQFLLGGGVSSRGSHCQRVAVCSRGFCCSLLLFSLFSFFFVRLIFLLRGVSGAFHCGVNHSCAFWDLCGLLAVSLCRLARCLSFPISLFLTLLGAWVFLLCIERYM